MRILVASSFENDADSGAAGTLLAIGHAWEQHGHMVEWQWIKVPPLSRILDEPIRFASYQLDKIRKHLKRAPDTDVVIVSQPYAYRAFESLKSKYPQTLFVNRTHGWEARWIESQNRFGWDPPTGPANRVLRVVAQRLRQRMCTRCVSAAHGIVAACREDAEWIRERYGLPPWRVASIPYGVDADLPPVPIRTRTGPVRLLFAGHYCERKGSKVLETVLPKLAAEYPEAELSFVVHSESESRIESHYRQNWSERLTVHRWCSREELYKLYAECDVLMLPSFFEGFGKVVVEGLAMGCVMLGFDEGGTADIDSPACITCPKGDVVGFDRIVRAALARQFDLAELSKLSVERGRLRTWSMTGVETITYFRELAAKHKIDLRNS